MKQQTVKKEGICVTQPKPVPRILLVHINSKKWKGCIYFSEFDLTGQLLMLLKDISADYDGEFLKNPIFVYTSTNKIEIETKISEKLLTLYKKN